jgi:lipopolysaccharide export system protein LptA
MRAGILLAAAFVVTLGGGARAQDFAAAFADFNTGSGDPIQIEADKLEVRDAEKVAIYSGHVRVRQGDTILEAPELRVFYAGEAAPNGTAGSSVTRIEAGPGVSVRSGDQTATGERAVLDMAKDLVTLEGNVILTQGTNVVRGDRVVVNLATKQGQVEGGRVQTLITPGEAGGQ